MLFRRYGSFCGGIELPDEKQATLNKAIEPAPPQERLLVPLAPCGPAARAVVKPGQTVKAGDMLGAAECDDAVDIFSPSSGTVVAITTALVFGGDDFLASPAVELTDLSPPAGPAETTPAFDWHTADSETLRRRIAQGGLTTHRGRCRPLARWVRQAMARDCRILVANVLVNQPCATSDHRLLAERGPDVICGLAILREAIEAGEIILAVDHRRTDHYRELVEPAKAYHVARIALPHKYPTGADPMLVKVLTGREMPIGGNTLDLHVAVVDAATCLAVYRWVACGSPPTGRVVTVAGEGARREGNFWAPFGTECSSLAGSVGDSLIHGGPMTGARCPPGAVVGPATDAVLAMRTPASTPGPCIRCSWCTDHCPARLNVAAMNDFFELGLVEHARRAGVLACVDCGVCSYICPAALPLSQRVKQLKQAVRNMRRTMPLFAH